MSKGVEQVAGTMVLGFCIQYIAVGTHLGDYCNLLLPFSLLRILPSHAHAKTQVRGSFSSVKAMDSLTRTT